MIEVSFAPADAALYTEIYQQLKRRACALRRGQHGNTLDTTALVHESFIKLVEMRARVHDRAHLFRLAALAMRQIFIDHLRERRERGAVAIVERIRPLLALHLIAEERVVPLQPPGDRLRVGIEQNFPFVKTVAVFRVVRTGHAVTVLNIFTVQTEHNHAVHIPDPERAGKRYFRKRFRRMFPKKHKCA